MGSGGGGGGGGGGEGGVIVHDCHSPSMRDAGVPGEQGVRCGWLKPTGRFWWEWLWQAGLGLAGRQKGAVHRRIALDLC